MTNTRKQQLLKELEELTKSSVPVMGSYDTKKVKYEPIDKKLLARLRRYHLEEKNSEQYEQITSGIRGKSSA